MSPIRQLRTIGAEVVRVAFGSPCIVCGEELPVRRRVASCCVDCWSGLPRLDEERCRLCALPLPAAVRGRDATCMRCASEPLATSWIDSWGRYDSGLTKVLHAFKFRGQSFLAEPLADLAAELVHRRANDRFDRIVPVPMSAARERGRGYNQAGLLAERLSRRVGITFDRRLLKKTTERRTQSELRKDERVANVRGTFVADSKVGGLSILLVDDVCTTGATLSECAATLLAAGARDVAAVTVARTP